MKKCFCYTLILGFALLVFHIRLLAQDTLRHCDQLTGKALHYNIHAMGQDMPFIFTIVRMGPPTVIQWTDPQGNSGWLQMDSSSLEQGNYSFAQQPYPNDTTPTAAGQTVLCLSRQAFNQLKLQGKTTYDGITYIRQADTTLTVQSLVVPVLHASASGSGAEIWILDDAAFPLLVATSGSPSGVDASWVGIEDK